jgi:hypothetical protein
MNKMLLKTLISPLCRTLLLLALATGAISCSKNSSSTSSNPTQVLSAAKLTAGSVSITGSGVTKGTVSVYTTPLYYTNVGMVRFDDAWGSKEVQVDLGTYDQAADFGGINGSLSLVAETQSYPLSGGAYPVLTSFYVVPTAAPGTPIEYVNLTAACATQGMWTCSGGNCNANPACTVNAASGFGGRTDWDQHQVPPYGYSTTNTFPRCDSSVAGWGSCPNTGLVSGHYYAKYLLLSDSGNSVASLTAGLKVTLQKKKDTQGRNPASSNGGINLNVILVGDHNINDAHTTLGARNLNLLFQEVNRLFATTSGVNLSVNSVKTYEWSNANGGSEYSQVLFSNLGNLFERGSKGVDATDAGQNINIFIVSDIQIDNSTFTILGLAGAILGPPVNGTQTSGLAFASFNKLATYNPNCTTAGCARELQQSDFLEMAATIVHELGHYLGLNHPSEKASSGGTQSHDALPDTPTCLARTSGSSKILDQRACYVSDTTVQPAPLAGSCGSVCNTATGGTGTVLSNSYLVSGPSSASIDPWTSYSNGDMPGKFCPAVQECQFNHVMWYTTKNRRLQRVSDGATCSAAEAAVGGTCAWNEDGNLFSPQSQAVIQWDPFVH